MPEEMSGNADTRIAENELIESFFRDFVEGWMLGDIRHCCFQEKSLAFTVATMVFTGVDFFGGLLKGRDSSKGGFAEFVQKYFAGEYAASAGDLYEVFRDGLVHQYFPKQQGAISWAEDAPHLTKTQGRYNLNAKKLAKDFEAAIAEYKQQLLVDPQLHANFKKRLEVIIAPPNKLIVVHPVDATSSASSPVCDLLRRTDGPFS
jgi:hypothetical protein